MPDYLMKFDGSHDLAWIENAIRGEEALATRFKGSQLSPVDGKVTNLATFEETDFIPNDVVLRKHPQPGPAGYTAAWSGVMLVQGANVPVTLFRKD
jgi:hypothetical protein